MKRNIFFYTLISLVLLFIDQSGFLRSSKKPVEVMIVAVKSSVYSASFILRDLPVFIMNYSSLKRDYAQLKDFRQETLQQKIRIQDLTEENADLRRQLGIPLPSSFQYRVAKIIGISRYMEIDQGSENGIREGMPVIDGEVLVGFVKTVSPSRSIIQLSSDPDSRISVKTDRGVKGVVSGGQGSILLLDKVLQKDPLFLGDLVLTTGEENIPVNLLVGKVAHILSEDVAVYKQARLDSLTDIYNMKNVFVITKL